MGASASKASPSSAPIGADGKPKKICCACPETKRARDECVVMHGSEDDGKCKALIEKRRSRVFARRGVRRVARTREDVAKGEGVRAMGWCESRVV